jgi:DNA-binding transcriptional ArsR family regulator
MIRITKLQVLDLLALLSDLNAAQVAERLRTSPEASGMILLRLTRGGLVFRQREDGVFAYRLTSKGRARHEYLTRRTKVGGE